MNMITVQTSKTQEVVDNYILSALYDFRTVAELVTYVPSKSNRIALRVPSIDSGGKVCK